jgi:hypothetical protein
MINNTINFNEKESDYIMNCVDYPEQFAININKNTNKVKIINIKENKELCYLGKYNALVEKFITYCHLKPLYLNI